MICNEQEYNAGIKELGLLIEQEDRLDAAELLHMSNLADALIAFERAAMEKQGLPYKVATASAKAEYTAAKRGDRILVAA